MFLRTDPRILSAAKCIRGLGSASSSSESEADSDVDEAAIEAGVEAAAQLDAETEEREEARARRLFGVGAMAANPQEQVRWAWV